MSQLLTAIAALKNVAQLPPGTTINIGGGHRDIIYVDDFEGDDHDKITAAMNKANETGARGIYLSGRQYNFTRSFQVNTNVPISGIRHKTVLRFSSGGLHLPDRLEGETIYVHYEPVILNFTVWGNYAISQEPNPADIGLLINCRAELQYITVKNFGGDAFHVFANLPNNASNAIITNCNAIECGGAGLFISGGDANSIVTTNMDVRDCRKGIIDESFLGNLHFKPMIHNCREESIVCISSNQENLVLHPYVEEDSPPMKIHSRNMSIGGQTRADFNSNHLKAYDHGFVFLNSVNVGSPHGNYTTYSQLGVEFGRFNADQAGTAIKWNTDAKALVIADRWTGKVNAIYENETSDPGKVLQIKEGIEP